MVLDFEIGLGMIIIVILMYVVDENKIKVVIVGRSVLYFDFKGLSFFCECFFVLF